MSSSPTVTLDGGVRIPQLGFGVFQIPPSDTVAAVSSALETGYRHIDTAAAYGNEEGVGQAISESGIPRDQVFVTTKLWNSDHGYDAALRAFDASLARLGFDYVDLYLVHWPAPVQDRYVETWKAFEQLHHEGRARAIGVSNFQPDHLKRLQAETTVLPAVNQVELHPTFQQAELRNVHEELGIVTEAWAPLGKSQDLAASAVESIAKRVGKTPAQVVLRWHLQQGHVVFPKSATPSRIRENFDVFDFELNSDDLAVIERLDHGNRIGPDPDTFG